MPEIQTAPSRYLSFDRTAWAKLRDSTPLTLSEVDLAELRGLNEAMSIAEVEQIYLPLSRLLSLYVGATQELHRASQTFLGDHHAKVPFIIGLAGSVAVGKSTTARILQALLSRWPGHPKVDLVTTDGFLFPNAELERRGIMDRKGFPESYDRRSLLRFVSAVKSGAREVHAPFYSHLAYDIVADAEITVSAPDVLIIEGLNVLQPPAPGRRLAVSDLFDFSIYVDARTQDIAHWYEERFLSLQRGAFANPLSYFHRFASLSEAEARARASEIWKAINEPNLVQNILPTRPRASLVLRKNSHHAVSSVLLRKT